MSTSKMSLNTIPKGRSCGGCDVCCYTMEIKEINKYQYCKCEYQFVNGGCSIWGKSNRPNACSSWNCAWLFGWYPEKYRPDKSGIVFYPMAAHLSDAKIAHIIGQEVWDGAIDSELGKQAFDLLSSKILTVVRHFASNQFSIAGPQDQIETWKNNIMVN